eukprot:scaffold3335_cov139-Skeletonema_marinoi.AAC.11
MAWTFHLLTIRTILACRKITHVHASTFCLTGVSIRARALILIHEVSSARKSNVIFAIVTRVE